MILRARMRLLLLLPPACPVQGMRKGLCTPEHHVTCATPQPSHPNQYVDGSTLLSNSHHLSQTQSEHVDMSNLPITPLISSSRHLLGHKSSSQAQSGLAQVYGEAFSLWEGNPILCYNSSLFPGSGLFNPAAHAAMQM
ncbi:hypothetical protein FRC12_025232 [Ceratobasidium sp. 428]|nr:hypothetical protein FRC12_025232 [Ceratobasidium sp. 428]